MPKAQTESVSRIIKRDDIRGKYPDDLNEEIAYHIGRAAIRTLFADQQDAPAIAVGWDARLSSPSLSCALIRGLVAEGADVVELGRCSTELVYFAVGSRPDVLAGGVMVTASHNPKDENGFKIVKRGAEPTSAEDLRKVGAWVSEALGESARSQLDLVQEYVDKVLEVSGIRRRSDSQRLRVVVEAGNGMGGVVFGEVARRLPFLDVIYSNQVPDGNFPVQLPNPLKPEYMALVQEHVRRKGADLGLAFDGDADRVGVVDHAGTVISASEILALVAGRFLGSSSPDRKIMYNLVCSRLVPMAIAEKDGRGVMTPVGHGQIKQRMRRPEHADCVFAGEHSGHYFFRDFFQVDSGMIAALIMIEAALAAKEAGGSLHDTVTGWRRRFFMSDETNFDFDRAGKLPEAQVRAEMQAAVDKVRDNLGTLAAAQRVFPKVEQVTRVTEYSPGDPTRSSNRVDILKMEFREDFGEWWCCVRPSGNEPLLRLVVEVMLYDGKVGQADGRHLLEERFERLVDWIGRSYLA